MSEEEKDTPLVHEGWDDIKDMKRGCTDCFCILLIVIVWIGLTILGFIATGVITNDSIPAGNPNRLLYATDYNGHICGTGNQADNPYAYYMLDGTTVICIDKCPTSLDSSTFYCKSDYQSIADASPVFGLGLTQVYHCMFSLTTELTLNRCIPNLSDSDITKLPAGYDIPDVSSTAGSGWFNSFIGDVYNQLGLIFGFGIGIATALSFVFIYGLRLPGLLTVVIWTLILSVLVLTLVGSFLLWDLGETYSSDGIHSYYESLTCQIFGYIGMGASFLYFCLILILCSRINLAIAIVKEASRAISAMPLIILMPIIQVFGVVCFLIIWTIYVIYLAASGDIVEKTAEYTGAYSGVSYTYKTLEYSENSKYAFLYMLFSWFWTSEFIVAFGQLSIALAITSWYFTRDKSLIGSGTVFWAMRTTFFCHMGTAAFGSLTIAIVKTIRAIIAYLQKQAQQQKNKLMEYVMCVCQCCMWCLEKCMKFLNKNAYIITAIYGYSFMKSARVAFFTLLRNILRVSAVNMVSDFILTLGKIFVPMSTVFILYLIMAYDSDVSSTSSGVISPLVFTFILAYFTSAMFCEIFGMGIQTILLCYIADEEMFAPEKRFADGSLQSAISKTAQAANSNNNSSKVIPTTSDERIVVDDNKNSRKDDPPLI